MLQTSRPQAVFLNHQLIILLSNLGIPDDVFMKLQRDMLDRLAGENVNNRSVSIDVAMCEREEILGKWVEHSRSRPKSESS